MHSMMAYIVRPQDVADLEEKMDEQTFDLMIKVFETLDKRFKMSDNEHEALRRVVDAVNRPNTPADAHRNNIFKAANAIGMKLPSGSF